MSEDLVKKRQALKNILEGKSEEKLTNIIRKEKSTPTRLNIPSIFQNKSVEDLTFEKLPQQNYSLSKSAGALFKSAAKQETNFGEKPSRKYSTSFYFKQTDDGKENPAEARRKLSTSFNLKLAPAENIFYENENSHKDQGYNLEKEQDDKVKSKINKEKDHKPKIVSTIEKRKSIEEKINDDEETEVKLDIIKNRTKLTKTPSILASSTICFNFIGTPSYLLENKKTDNNNLKTESNNISNENINNSRLKILKTNNNFNETKSSLQTTDEIENKKLNVYYENMQIFINNNYYSRKFSTGPVYKIPIPSPRINIPSKRMTF